MIVSACSEPPRPDDQITVTPARLDLEPIGCGGEATVALTVHNPRRQPVDLAISSTLAGVTVVPARATLAAEDSLHIEVALTAPATPMTATGALVIAIGDENLAVPIIVPSTGVAVAVDPPLLDFGEALPGDSIEREVTVSATGTAPASVTLSAPSSAEYQLRGATATIRPGDSHRFAIRFTAGSTPRTHPATLALAVDGPLCGAPPVLDLIGGTSHGLVVLDRAIIDFGSLRCAIGIGGTELELANRGQVETDFAVRVTDPASLFFAANLFGQEPRGNLAASASAKVIIGHRDFRNLATGLHVGVVEVSLNGGTVVKSLPVRAVIERAIVKPVEDTIDFGDVPAGARVTRTFQIVNSGNIASEVRMHTADSELAIAPSRLDVAPGTRHSIDVAFTAAAAPGTVFDGFVSFAGPVCERVQAVAIRARVVAD